MELPNLSSRPAPLKTIKRNEKNLSKNEVQLPKVQQLSDGEPIEPFKDRDKIIRERLTIIATAIKSTKK
jgi:hypothetical protein